MPLSSSNKAKIFPVLQERHKLHSLLKTPPSPPFLLHPSFSSFLELPNMRIGICSIQQSLTPEATNLVKLAITLGRRRGHAQVTPIHVASAMLASPTSLLKTACLQSHSHPLQLKALELCFNVALNRLPSSATSPLLSPQSISPYRPSLSNALVATFKRAQTHQRRGCVENQQQPILALKIEIEQLVISILDDPSVSRVMREAGFSSPHVKNNVEQVVSMDFYPQSVKELRPKSLPSSTNLTSKYASSSSNLYEAMENDDVLRVLHTLTSKKARSIAIVGETLAEAEAVAYNVMSKIESGQVDGILRCMQLTSLFNISTLQNLSKQDVEQRLMELRGVVTVKGYGGRGMALYLGDLKWVAEVWSGHACDTENRRNSHLYNPVEHIVIELRKLIFGDSGKVWLLGSSSSKTYMKCKLGHPSFESFLEFNLIKVPICSLDLSLKIERCDVCLKSSDFRQMQLFCCTNVSCNVPFSDMFDQPKARWLEPNKEGMIRPEAMDSMSSKLPSWLQQCKDEFECKPLKNLKKTRITEKDLMLSMSTPCSPTSVSSTDQPNPTHLSWPVVCEPADDDSIEPSTEMFVNEIVSKPELLSNPNSSPNSATSSEVDMQGMDDDDLPKFNELNDENLKVLCDTLERNAPKDTVLEIATTVLKCRSRAMERKGLSSAQQKIKKETWMCFLGDDDECKENVAKELALVVFSSLHNFVKLSFKSLKRKRNEDEDENSSSKFLDRFTKAVYENPHCVFYLEGLEQLHYNVLKTAIQSGNVELQSGEIANLEDAIVIFNCESSSSVTSPILQKTDNEEESTENNIALDLNVATGEEELSLSLSSVTCNSEILESVDKIVVFKSK